MRKLLKLTRILSKPKLWRGLPYGVAATVEHLAILSGLPVRTVIDVGAYKGQFSLLARGLYPDASIFAYEPLPGPAAVYERLFNGAERVNLSRCALGASSGTMTMHVAEVAHSSSLLPIGTIQVALWPHTREVCEQNVPVRRLDEVLAYADITAPALLKIDVQGYELEVLKGAVGLLDRLAYILCEVSFLELYEGQPLADTVKGWLGEHGFSFHCAGQPSRDKRGIPVQVDMLFVRTAP